MTKPDPWADPKVKWKQDLIHECLSAELNSPDEAMSLECLLLDVADGRENRKFPITSPEFVECLAALSDSSSTISREFEETGLICESDAEEIVKTFLTCASNLLVAPAWVLKFFGAQPTDEPALFVARRHLWTELVLTQAGQKLIVQAALDVGVEFAQTDSIDTLLTQALRKFELEQVFQQAVSNMVDPAWVQTKQIEIVLQSF